MGSEDNMEEVGCEIVCDQELDKEFGADGDVHWKNHLSTKRNASHLVKRG